MVEINEGGCKMSERNKQVAVQFIEAMGQNDPERAAETLAPDAVAIAMGTTNFAGKRSRDMMVGGIDEFKHLLPEGLQFTIKSVMAEGDRVAVEALGNGTTSGGTQYHNNYVFMITLRDGLIVEAKEYFCTKLADEVLWPLVAGAGNLGHTLD